MVSDCRYRLIRLEYDRAVEAGVFEAVDDLLP